MTKNIDMKQLQIVTIFIVLVFTQNGSAQNSFPTFKFIDQIWMRNNLDVTTFQNGDSILHAQTETEWLDACRRGEPAWCYPVHNTNPNRKFEPIIKPRKKDLVINEEKLYNWYAVIDPRNIAPIGFKVASEDDWKIFNSYRKKAKKPIIGDRSMRFYLDSLQINEKNLLFRSCYINGVFDKNIFKAEIRNVEVNLSRNSHCVSHYGPNKSINTTCIDNYSWWTTTENQDVYGHAFIFQLLTNGTVLSTASYSKACGFFVRCVKYVE